MIYDTTGILLVPEKGGMHCPGNGLLSSECCCDECDYLICCTDPNCTSTCESCADPDCPHAVKNS